jgi:hypothetical protein
MTNEIKNAWKTQSVNTLEERVEYLIQWLAGYDEEYSKGYWTPSHTKEEIALEITVISELIEEKRMPVFNTLEEARAWELKQLNNPTHIDYI